MSETGPNPYAPPATEAFAAQSPVSMDALLATRPISFRGAVTLTDLHSYLLAFEHVGCGSMLMIGLVLGAVLMIAALAIGGGMILVSLGLFGLLVIAFASSVVSYRQVVFQSSNPHWNAAVEGELKHDGLQITRSGATNFFRWDWFDGAVLSEQTVSLIPALHPHQPIIISADMLSSLDDWDRLLGVAQIVGLAVDGRIPRESRRLVNRRLMRNRQRQRSIEVPPDAIPFQGTLKQRDLASIPASFLRRDRPPRAYLVIAGLTMFGLMLLFGTAQLAGFDGIVVPIMLGTIVVSLLLRHAIQRRKSIATGGQTVYHLTAYADESGITSDFRMTVTFVPWELMQLSASEDNTMALARRDARQFLVARRAMFESEHHWSRFQELVRRRVQ